MVPRTLVATVPVVLLAWSATASAATIVVSPGDDYKKIEAAVAGDTVLIAPGTYQFRVYLTQMGTASQPITIRAQDPKNPPVWDLQGKLVENWPGSYTGGDNGRGCWQVGGGSYYEIDDIVFQNCTTASQNSAGFRYNAADHITLRNVVIHDSEMGLTGSGTNILVESSELYHNGSLANLNEETHNLYIYDGSFTMRYSYVHDSVHGQNFHLRCRDCLLESNWIARAQNYEGDLMTTASGATQKLVMRGNVIVQAQKPENGSFIIAPFNDDMTATNLNFEVDLYWNTIIGNGGGATLLMFNNANIATSKGVLSNNVIVGNMVPYGATDMTKATFGGSNNWLMTGASPTTALKGTIFGSTANLDSRFRPLPGSPLIGASDTLVLPHPLTEYFQDEVVTRQWRLRLTAKDIGAFESTTTGPGADGGVPDAGDTPPDAGDGGDSGPGPVAPDASGGCGCTAAEAPAVITPWGLALGALALVARRRRRRER